MLRIEAGRHPDVELIGQLSTRSAASRTRWVANDVRAHRGCTKVFRHPVIGELTLLYENLHVDYPEADAVHLLASRNADSGVGRPVGADDNHGVRG